MKNKNTETIEQYVTLSGTISQALNELKELMNKPEFKDAVNYDQEVNDGDNCLNGEFSCYIQDLAETWARE